VTLDRALAEIESLPGNPYFANDLFEGMRGMSRLWQAAGTVQSILKPGLMEKAAEAGFRNFTNGAISFAQVLYTIMLER